MVSSMKIIILAGGLGSRLSEETNLKPKPMVEIGGKPILWHIMKIYSYYGFNEFIILCGYKGYMIKEYFVNYNYYMTNITVDLSSNSISFHSMPAEPWKVTLIDTGLENMTGSRIKQIKPYVGEETFMLTYGDGVSDVNINELLAFHRSHGELMTMMSSQPAGRFGALEIEPTGKVRAFNEKPAGDGAWVNAGFFVCEPAIFDFIPDGPEVVFEHKPLEHLAATGKLYTFRYTGFWKPMDTQRDKLQLDELISKNQAPWIKW